MSREYILLNTLEQKTAFSAIYRLKQARNRPVFCRFWLFRMAVKVYMTSMKLSTTTPGPGTPPANSRRAKQFWSRPHGLWLFLSVGPELPDYSPGNDVLPPSLLLVAMKSYMTSSRTTTPIYIAARIRVNSRSSIGGITLSDTDMT
jgi:hypothetical protein